MTGPGDAQRAEWQREAGHVLSDRLIDAIFDAGARHAADRIMRLIAKDTWPEDPSPLEEDGYEHGLRGAATCAKCGIAWRAVGSRLCPVIGDQSLMEHDWQVAP